MEATPPWIADAVQIEEKNYAVASYRFSFISKKSMPSQNDSILQHPNAILFGCIISGKGMCLNSIIIEEILLRECQH